MAIAKKKASKKSLPWKARRKELAERLAEGMAGWLQLQGSQRLANLPGEDAARFVIAQIVQATGRYVVGTSKRPTNWPENDKKRIDLALLGTSSKAKGWYGAIEAKWPGSSFAIKSVRLAILQDCMRLASTKSANLNATLLVLGGMDNAIKKLFDNTHTKPALEAARVAFDKFLPRAPGTKAKVSGAEIGKHYPKYAARVPSSVLPKGTIVAELLATADAVYGGKTIGSIFVWNISKQRGRKRKTTKSPMLASTS